MSTKSCEVEICVLEEFNENWMQFLKWWAKWMKKEMYIEQLLKLNIFSMEEKAKVSPEDLIGSVVVKTDYISVTTDAIKCSSFKTPPIALISRLSKLFEVDLYVKVTQKGMDGYNILKGEVIDLELPF